ncbi:MAG: polysaccharide biosynthesis/export family protein [Bacteroidaceae bacterium]|nr:polysaccharide biosynthesis/export family protein [Bacteroidaceae bacterium]
MIKRTYKDFGYLLLSVMLLASVASCNSYKKVPYMQNSSEFRNAEQGGVAHEPRIQPQDLLDILVLNPDDPAASLSYNMVAPTDFGDRGALTSQPTLQEYLVNSNGEVVIPNLGAVKLGGLTLPEAENLIIDKVKGAFSTKPVVTVRFADFKISVLGEVTAPGTYSVKNGKVNVLQALALARDMTIYGMRDNVKLIRENENGKKEIIELNLNDASILNSPYYYLCQNDVLYVTPNKSKAKNSDIGSSTSLWFSATSILISLTSLMYNILK